MNLQKSAIGLDSDLVTSFLTGCMLQIFWEANIHMGSQQNKIVMRRKSRRLLITGLSYSYLFLSFTVFAGDSAQLWNLDPKACVINVDAAKRIKAGEDLTAEDYVISTCPVTIDLSVLTLSTSSFTIALPDGKQVEIKKVRATADRKEKESFTWVGTVEKRPDSSATFAVRKDRIFGDVVTPDGIIYRLRTDAEKKRFFVEVLDQKKLPKHKGDRGSRRDQPLPPDTYRSVDLVEKNCADPHTLDILVLFTKNVKVAVGNSDLFVRDLVSVAVEETETSFSNSGISLTVSVKDVLPFAYSETGNLNDAFLALQSTGNSLRKTASADLVVLITNDVGGGQASQLQSNHIGNLSFAPIAYAVVSRVSATGGYGFGHELGHILGAHHQNSSYNGAYSFSKALVHPYPPTAQAPPNCPSVGWGTMMSDFYGCANCKVQQFWSDPTKDLCGIALGRPNRNNALTLNSTAATVTKFSCAISAKDK